MVKVRIIWSLECDRTGDIQTREKRGKKTLVERSIIVQQCLPVMANEAPKRLRSVDPNELDVGPTTPATELVSVSEVAVISLSKIGLSPMEIWLTLVATLVGT